MHRASVRLSVTSNCIDLGVSYDANLSFTSHISKIVAKASGCAKLFLKCFSSRDPLLLIRAFCTFVRHFQEFSSIIWSPYTISDSNCVESVQRSFTKAVNYLRFSTYKERLVNLGLDSLQCRRIKGSKPISCFAINYYVVSLT